MRCGDVGLRGLGCHAHNDALSFELSLGEQPLIVDPGTFVYTPDPAERNRFRSTGWHSTLQVGEEEQNELRSDYLFLMDDRARAHAIEWTPGTDGRAVFAGRHVGFPGATHERRFEFDGPGGTLAIVTPCGPMLRVRSRGPSRSRRALKCRPDAAALSPRSATRG